jgi:hypothetical protein
MHPCKFGAFLELSARVLSNFKEIITQGNRTEEGSKAPTRRAASARCSAA